MIEFEIERLKQGIELVNKAVSRSLGAVGMKAIINESVLGDLQYSQDGAQIAESIVSDDPIVNTGVLLLKEVSRKSDQDSRDGTTTATVIAAKLLEGLEEKRPYKIVQGMKTALEDTLINLKKGVRPVDAGLLLGIAEVSTRFDPILSKVMFEAFEVAGVDGFVSINPKGDSHTLKVSKGMSVDYPIDRIYLPPNTHSITEDMDILVTNWKIDNFAGFTKEGIDAGLLMDIWDTGKKVLIICNEISDNLTETILSWNATKNGKVYIQKVADLGEISETLLLDIGFATGTTAKLTPHQKVTEETKLGKGKVTLTQDNSIIEFEMTEDIQNEIQARQKYLNGLDEDSAEYQTVQDSIRNLANVSVTVNIGGATMSEQAEAITRAVDATGSMRAAMRSGLVIGAGKALYNCSKKKRTFKDKAVQRGYDLFMEAIREPALQILRNADLDTTKLDKLPKNKAINVLTEKTVDLWEMGLVDAHTVIENSLKVATSVATTVLTTSCIIYDRPNNKILNL